MHRIKSKRVEGAIWVLGYGFVLLCLVFLLLNFLFPIRTNISYSTLITDRNGEILYSFLSNDEKWRLYTELSEISPEMERAFLYKEDKYFYWHYGTNPIAIVRATFNNIVKNKRTSGASTITMQVVRLLEPRKRTYFNKIVEMFRATQLEYSHSKKEILQLYLNLVPYGGNIEGVKSAAVLFFNKEPNHLSLGEITALAVIPNKPGSLALGKKNDEIELFRNQWLQRFLEDEVFEKKTIQDALHETLNAYRRESPKWAPHLAYRLKNNGESSPNIKSTISKGIQVKVEQLMQQYTEKMHAINVYNAAALIVDNKTHEVLCYVGNANFYDNFHGGQVDGVKGIRQPGSTLKPLIYAMAFDKGLLTPKQKIEDVPFTYMGYSPSNFDQQFRGYVTVEEALKLSLNIPAVKTLHSLNVDTLSKALMACGFETIAKQKNVLGLSTALGGCGTNLQELTALYTMFANQGVYQNLQFTSLSDSLITDTVLSKDAVFMLTEILNTLERPELPASWQNASNIPNIAWKTGTSYGRKDAWSIGYNDAYTIGVWLGNFSGEGVPELTGADIATPLLFKLFGVVDKQSSKHWIKAPVTLKFRMVCEETGMLPSDFCEHKIIDYFIPLKSSTQYCQHQKKYFTDEKESLRYCMHCIPSLGYKEVYYPNHSVEMIAYFKENGIAYKEIPSHNPNCSQFNQNEAPKIKTPKDGTVYYIIEDEKEPLVLECLTATSVKKVFWYINNQVYKETEKEKKVLFEPPSPGFYKISCSDDAGNNTDVEIEVVFL